MPQETGLPQELKITFFVALLALLIILFFVILAIVIYSKKQKTILAEKRLQESEFEKDLLNKELEKVKSIQLERERISQDMHDDIGSTLSAITLQAMLLKKKVAAPELEQDIAYIISDVAHINSSIREMIWSLQRQNDYLMEFLHYIQLYAKQFFAPTTIAFQFSSSIENETAIPFSADTRRNMLFVIKEALNNIVKHSGATQVTIQCVRDGHDLLIQISDNGKGFTRKQLGGNGLLNMENRMKRIDGSLQIHSTVMGVHIHVRIKLQELE